MNVQLNKQQRNEIRTIVRTTPTEEGLEGRTFECAKYHHVHTLIFKTA